MKEDKLQTIVDLAHSNRGNPVNEALIEMIDAYIGAMTELRIANEHIIAMSKELGILKTENENLRIKKWFTLVSS